jgi:hypothetical protein
LTGKKTLSCYFPFKAKMSSSRPTEPPDPEVPETGAVFTFGRAKYAAENAPNKFWIKKDEVSHHYREEREVERREQLFLILMWEMVRKGKSRLGDWHQQQQLFTPFSVSSNGRKGGEREINDNYTGVQLRKK